MKDIDISHNPNDGVLTMALSMGVGIILALIKAYAGIVGNSYALVADALESSTDVVSAFVVMLGLRYALKPPDDDHPYGHGRAESLVTFIVVGILFLTAVVIIYQSINNILTPHDLPATFTLYVLGGVILSKELMFHWVLYQSKKLKSSSLLADAHHQRSDVITSIAAFIGICIALWMGPGYESADDWAACIAAIFILINCYKIFKPAWGEIMDVQNHNDLQQKIKAISKNVAGVLDTEKCYIRKSGLHFIVDLHIEVNGQISVEEGHEIAHKVSDALKKSNLGIIYVSMHVEPYGVH